LDLISMISYVVSS